MIVTSKVLAHSTVDRLADQDKNPDNYRGYPFPSAWFMNHTGGWGRDWLCFLYGLPGSGKSGFMNTTVIELGRKNINFLYVSLEENLFIIGQKVIANIGGVNRTKFRDVKIEANDWPAIHNAVGQFETFSGNWGDDLYDWEDLYKSCQAYLPDVLLIDYIQLMSIKNAKGMTETVARISKLLQRLAHGKLLKNPDGSDHPVSVICAAQLNNEGNPLYSFDPDRDGDFIIQIDQIDDGAGGTITGQRKVTIRKAKYGVVDSVNMAFFGDRALFGDLYLPGTQNGPIPNPPKP